MSQQLREQGYFVSADRSKIDLEIVHHFLTNSYWAKGISLENVEKCVENSLSFGVYKESSQVGFARVITDYARLAHLADVFILEKHRGLGLAKLLMDNIMRHPELQSIKKWTLLTEDAHGLYRQFGFQDLEKPEIYMEMKRSHV